MKDPFSDPAQGGGIWEDLEGHLIAIQGHEIVKARSTFPTDSPDGMIDAIRCTVYDIDENKTYEGQLMMSASLVIACRPYVNKTLVLGTLGKQKFKRGPGWSLTPAGDKERNRAREWHESAFKDPFSDPETDNDK